MYLKDDRGKYYQQLKQLYYLLAEESQALASDRRRERQQEFHGTRFAADISWNGRKRKCRLDLGLDKLLHTKWTTVEDYQQLTSQAKKDRRQVKESIGLSVKKLNPSQIYTELIAQLGLKTEAKEKRSHDGKKIRIRRITPQSWELARLFIIHRENLRLQCTTKNPQLNQPEIGVSPLLLFLSQESEGVRQSQGKISKALEPSSESQNLLPQKSPHTSSSKIINLDSMAPHHTTKAPLDREEATGNIERPKLTDYKIEQIVWLNTRKGWFQGWIAQVAHHPGGLSPGLL